jgi:hypothetical protein
MSDGAPAVKGLKSLDPQRRLCSRYISPSFHYDGMMAKKKTTVYVDEEVLRAAKVYAARKDVRDSDVIEGALRAYLGLDVLQPAWDRNADVDPDEADHLAYAELAAARAERRRVRP